MLSSCSTLIYCKYIIMRRKRCHQEFTEKRFSKKVYVDTSYP